MVVQFVHFAYFCVESCPKILNTMKYTFTILLFCLIFVSNAQPRYAQNKTKPVFEKEGDLVKITKYYDTGEIKEQGFYDAEKKLTGKWLLFDKAGKKTTIAHYYKGQKVGKWFVWKEERLLELDFENSKIASVSEWKDQSTIADN
jgi:hypothetical protein